MKKQEKKMEGNEKVEQKDKAEEEEERKGGKSKRKAPRTILLPALWTLSLVEPLVTPLDLLNDEHTKTAGSSWS